MCGAKVSRGVRILLNECISPDSNSSNFKILVSLRQATFLSVLNELSMYKKFCLRRAIIRLSVTNECGRNNHLEIGGMKDIMR